MNIQNIGTIALRFAILNAVSFGVGNVMGAEPFQVKGRQIGQSVSEACKHFPTETKLDDLVKELQSSIKGLTQMNTTSCVVDGESFAGVAVPRGIQLMFVSDKLVQVKFELEAVQVLRSWEILSTLVNQYGKPKTDQSETKSMGWTMHSWTQSNQKLIVNRQNSGNENQVLEVVLRDEPQFAKWQKSYTTNSRLIEASKRRDMVRDTR